MKSKTKFITRLARNERGAIAPLFLVTTALLLSTSLGATDLVRYSVAQDRLQHALDGATLSAGCNLANLTSNPGQTEVDAWQQDAYAYFRSNLPEGYLGSSINPDDLKITYENEIVGGKYVTGQNITMTAKGNLPLLSTGLQEASSFSLQASNQAIRRTRADLELVMALDNTGSMADDDKIGTLKTAAQELSSTVLGAAAAAGGPQRVYVGLVPFADTVNVGNSPITRQWLTYPTEQTDFINTKWSGCIVEPRTDQWGGTDLPAKAWTPLARFQPLHLTLHTLVTNLGLANKESIAPVAAGKPQPRSFDANGAAYDRRVWARKSDNTSFDVYSAANPSNCTASRLSYFLNDDLETINTAIQGMQANGSTLIPTGLLWAWRMLDPTWRGTLGWGNPDMPRDPDPKVLTKVIVLLTDGENQPSTTGVGASSNERKFAFGLTYNVQSCKGKNCSPASPPIRTYTKGVFTAEDASQQPMNSLKMRDPFSADSSNSQNSSIGWGSTTNISPTTTNTYMQKLCDNVKSDGNGIKIYTVTLGPVGTSAETKMNNCSSGPGYFYNATTVSDLPDVFKSIAGALTELRLTL